MSEHIVLFNDDLAFLNAVTEALRSTGLDVTALSSSLRAWEVISRADRLIDILVTRIGAPKGTPHGVSLAGFSKQMNPSIKVIFTGVAENAAYADGLGPVLIWPIAPVDLVQAVRVALSPCEKLRDGR